ncbi:hypothetical protein TCAL_01528 [Tigriopus californicus]|uniref:Biopterin-dependent aromatic amino acid hydroxylase family profile domain-containing protein n=1 Tax=Tigriopus californicus TaxID=6832 RepID=A0A553P898_TIGCA|nr:tyrosine 3-monooxygenase-like [Tigriopus californicus]TRY73897.1 hypothetical protein TCAL_01528 [Tigriopus californicus]
MINGNTPQPSAPNDNHKMSSNGDGVIGEGYNEPGTAEEEESENFDPNAPEDTNLMAKKNRDRFAINKSYSIENGYQGTKRNLVNDAKFETKVHLETKKNWLQAVRQQSEELADEELGDDDVFVLESIAEAKKNEDDRLRVTMVISLKETINSLSKILKIIEINKGDISHMETRESQITNASVDVLLKIDIKQGNLLHFLKALKRCSSLNSVQLLSSKAVNLKFPWFPRHISELDQCNHLVTKFEPELDMDHPGWSDQEYRKRRMEIAQISFNYRHGDPIPRIRYTPDEIKTWKAVFTKVEELLPGRACKTHRRVLELMKKECGYSEDNIPQMEDISMFLKKTSGFTLRPAAGLVTARDFLASLAFRVFQCTQYMRHSSSPHHSPEPDAIHELLGHCPMFADPLFAQFSQEIGLASLGASDKEIENLATLYWFTVEFGLCRENGQVRAYGAGLLSSYGELLYALSDKPELRDFEPASAAVQEYDDQAYQEIYYVAQSFEDAMEKFRRWVAQNMTRPVEMRFNPYTQTIEVIDSVNGMENLISQMRLELNHLNNALGRIKV